MNKKESNRLNDEIRIYGENACLTVFKNRPEDIIQCFFTKQKTKDNPTLIRDITTYLAKNKKTYKMVTKEELEKLTRATHHEEISMLIKKRAEVNLTDFLNLKKEKCLLIILEDVSNPHNIGAIIRTAAHFGVDGLILTSKKMAETASAIRVSEGGFDFVNVFETENIKAAISELHKEKFQIITTSSHAKKTLKELSWKKKAVIVLGEEGKGLSKDIMSQGDCINIAGTNHVESLNVSVATSILMYDFFTKVK